MDDFPGPGDYATLKVPKVLSIGCGALVQYHVSPAREHGSRHLEVNESWRGYGLRAYLASASLARLRAYEARAVRFVIRFKEHWKPKVDYVARGQVTQEFFPGTDPDVLLAEETLRLDGQIIDTDIHVGQRTHTLPLRLVGGQAPKGYRFFLTNPLPRIGPRQVADLYRADWEVELTIKQDQPGHRLDAIAAERPCSHKALLHASFVASLLAALLACMHTLKTRPLQIGAPRTEAPLHPRRLSLQPAVSCQSTPHAFDLHGDEATRRWDKIAELLTHASRDPQGRRRPSVFDQLCSWKHQPMAPNKAAA